MLVIGLLLVGVVGFAYLEETHKKEILFQGPVPEGYNQTHYWETGETILNDIGYEKGTLVNGKRIVEYKGTLREYKNLYGDKR